MDSFLTKQKELCARMESPFVASPKNSFLAASKNIELGVWPIHGLRHPVTKNINGWYIWAGDYSEEERFFSPIHVSHFLDSGCIVSLYLGLAPGWRFLIAPDYEDVWFDESLLNVD